MLRSRRSLLLLAGLTGLSLLSCGREVTGPGDGIPYGRNRIAALAVAPEFPRIPGAHAISDVVPFTQVRITLRRADGVVAKDTLINFPVGVDSVALAVDVPLPITAPDSGITLGLSLAYVNAAGDTVFRGGPLPVTARPSGGAGSSQTVSIPVTWVPPPGVPLPASVDLTPATGNAVAGGTTTFTATARDGQGAALAGIPVVFSSIDTTRAVVGAPGNGLVTWRAVRGPARIVATLANLVADTATFTISLPASRLLLVSGNAQSATASTALGAPIVLRVTASDSIPVSGIPVTFAVTTGAGTLLASADTSDASGLVQFSWTLGSLVGAQSVTATLSTNNATFVSTATGLAPLPTQVTFTASPTTAVAGTTLSAVTVEARDAGGARASAFAGPVTIALDAGATGATLAGTTTVNAVAGIATFANLSIQRAATGLTFIATSAGLTPDTSTTLAITAAAAANLANISGTGQSTTISTALAAPFIVRTTDAFANPVPGVTVTWAITAGGGSLSAPTSVTDANGHASITYTTGTATGTSTVTGTVAGLTGSPASFSTTVGSGAATALVFTSSPTGSFPAGTTMANIVVQARDAGNNLAVAFAGNVVLHINTGPGANGDSLVVAAVGGVATFIGVDFGDAGSYTLRADAAGLIAGISPSFDIVAGPPFAIIVTAGNAQSGAVGAALTDSLVFVLRDSIGNPITNTGWTIAVTGGGGSVSPAGGNTNAAGEIRVRWTLGAVIGAQSISAFVTATPAINATATATGTVGAVSQIVLVTPPTTGTVNIALPTSVVELRDALGNLVTSSSAFVGAVIDSGPAGGTLAGNTPIQAVAGVASFTNIGVSVVGNYRLRYTSAGVSDVLSPVFTVNPPTAVRLVVTQQPGSTTSNAAIPTMVVQAQDAVGNPATGFAGNVEVVVDSGPALGWSMGGTQVIAAVGGNATFSTVTLDRAGQYRLRFRSAGLDSAISAPFLVNAGPAATITAVEGDGQTAATGTPLPTMIGARIADAFGNPISGVTVTWSATSGGGSVAPPTTVTDLDGIARATWTLGAATGAQTAQGVGASFTAPFTANATANVANVTWTGAVNANWSEPGNWSGGTVPTASDSVRIPAVGASPVLDVPAFVNQLRVESGVTFTLDTFPVIVGGRLDIVPSAIIVSDSVGAFVLVGATGSVNGPMPRLVVQNGAHPLAGALAVSGDLVVSAGSLWIDTWTATVGGLFSTIGTGTLVMNGPGTLTVEGDAIFGGGSTAGQLTAGVLTVRGDFVQGGGSPQSFSAGAGHTVVLDGPASQSVTLLNPDVNLIGTCATSCFGTLRSLRAAGTGPLAIMSDLKALGIIDVSGEELDAAGHRLISSGTPSLASDIVSAAYVGWQDALVRSGGVFNVDTLIAWGTTGTLIVGEDIPTIVTGAYSIAGAHPAQIAIIGPTASLNVNGAVSVGSGTGPALRTLGGGRVIMQQPADTLIVNGDVDFGGAAAPGLMNAGVLRLAGNFNMSNESIDAFIAEGPHVTQFVAPNPTARFSRIGGNHFANVDIASNGAMTFDGNANISGTVKLGPTVSVVGGGLITIGGSLLDSLGTRWQATETFFQAADPVIPHQFIGSVVFLNGVVLDTALSVGTNLEIRGGLLDLNGQRVEVQGTFEARDSGALRMVNAADTLAVMGPARFRGASSVGQLTAGRLDLHNSFEQLGNAEAFAASAGHETWFLASSPQTTTFLNPGFGAGTSHFGTLYLAQPIGGRLAAGSDIYVDGELENGTIAQSTVQSAGHRVVSRGADFSSLQFENTRWQLVDGAPVSEIDSLTFVSMDPAGVSFEIIRSGGTIAIPNLRYVASTPTSGRYLRVEDSDGAAGGVLTIDLSNISPTSHGGFLEVVNGAVVNGWSVGAFEWTGAVSTDWALPGNWAQNVVPAASDSVYIPATGVANMPALESNQMVRALVNDNAQPIAINTSATLEITSRAVFRGDVPGVVCTAGAVEIGAGSANATLRGQIDCVVGAVATTVALEGPTTVLGAGHSLTAASGTDLVVNAQKLVVAGTLFTQGTGRFLMTNAADSVDVGDVDFNGGSTSGVLVDGDLIIRGGLTTGATADAFSASGPHRTRFLPGIGDTVNVSATNSAMVFGSLDVSRPIRISGQLSVSEITNVRSGAIVGPGRLSAAGDFIGATGTLVAPAAIELLSAYSDTGTFRPDTTIFAGGGQFMPFVHGGNRIDYQNVLIAGSVTFAFSGGTDSIAADLIVNGTLIAGDNGTTGDLRVARDLRVGGSGRLFSTTFPHAIEVYRHASFDGAASSGDLALGTLRVRGDFTQAATTSAQSFLPAPAYSVYLDSAGTLSFASPGTSRFSSLVISQTGAVRTLLTDVNVDGVIGLNADGGATLQSDVLNTGGTRLLTANGVTQGGTMQFRNVAFRVQGTEPVAFSSTLTFSDFDPNAIQFEVARDSATITIYDPIFNTTPVANGRYLRVIDTNIGDGANLVLEVNGTPTPALHGGFAEAQAPATLIGWGVSPDFVWTGGAATSDWNTPANWSSGAVPAATDSVFIPGALPNNPLIPSGTTLRSLVSARTESAIQSDGPITITSILSVPIVGGLDCGGAQLSFDNAVTPMRARGAIACFTRLLNGTLTVNDSLGIIGNDLQVEGTSVLDAISGVLVVDGQFSTMAGGQLRMQNDSAHIALNSGASFGGGSTAGLLTAGLLEIGGNFTQNGDVQSFSASGAHVTEFHGGALQQVVFANPGAGAGTSHFAHLALGQTSAGVSVQLNSDVQAIGQLRSGTGTTRSFSTSNGSVLRTNSANISDASFDAVRWELLEGPPVGVISNISFSNQDVTLNQFTVIRSGGVVTATGLTFSTPPTTGFYVRAQDPDSDESGFLSVSLGVITPAGHGGRIQTAGGASINGWNVTGPFIWTGAEDTNWEETNNWLNGIVPGVSDSVTISAAATTGPEITAPTTIRALVNLSASATMTLNEAPLTITRRLSTLYGSPGVTCVGSSGLLRIEPGASATVAGHVACDLVIAGDAVTSLSDSLLVGRSTRVNDAGEFDVNGHKLRMLDSLIVEQNGTLRIANATSVVDVTRDVSFRSSISSGLFTQGRLRVGGDFTQSGGGASFDASPGLTLELYDAFAGAEGTPTLSLSDPINSRIGTLAFTSGGRDIANGITVQGDVIFGTLQNVTSTAAGTFNVLGSITDTTTYGGSPATLTLPRLDVQGIFDFRGTLAVDTVYFGGVAEQGLPASTGGTRVAYRTVLVGGPRVVTVASPVDSLVTTGDLHVMGTGALRFAESGATAVTQIGEHLIVLPGGSFTMTEAGATVIAQNGATLQGTSTANNGVLRIGGDVSIAAGALTAVNLHITELFDGNPMIDGFTISVADSTAYFATLRPESGSWTFAGTGSDTLLIQTALNMTGTANLDGEPYIKVYGPVQGQPGSTLALRRLAYFNNWQFEGTYAVDTLSLIGSGGQPLYARDGSNNPIPYNVVRITGDARPIVDPADELVILNSLIIDGGLFHVGTVANGTDSVRVQVNGRLQTINGGRLEMTHAEGRLAVNGDAIFSGGSTQGLLTAGLLMLRSDFTSNGDPESFAASGNHETQFSTEGTQQINMANASPVIGGASHFNHFRIQQASGSRVDLLARTVAIGQFRATQGSTAIVRSSSEVFFEVGGTAIFNVRFDNVLFVIRDGAPVDFLQDVTFDSTSAGANPFRVLRAGGTVTLDNPTFNVVPNNTPGVYLVVADQAQLDGDTLTVVVMTPSPAAHGGLVATFGGHLTGWNSGVGATWTGAIDADWNTIGNWSTGIIPDHSTDVTIPVTSNNPTVSGQRRVHDLALAAGATLRILESEILTATGNVVIDGTIIANTVNDPSIIFRMAPASNSTLGAAGAIGAKLHIASGGVSLIDSVRVTGNVDMGVEISDALLNLGGRRMNVTGSFSTTNGGRLQMTNPADSLLVDENILFDGGDTEGMLTNGTIIAAHDFSQVPSTTTRAFAATGSHLVRFVGNTYDSQVNFSSTSTLDSRFANVALDKALPRAVRFFNTPFVIENLVSITSPVIVDNGNVEVTGSVVQPGANGTWDVGPTSTVNFTGVNQSTCDGFTFTVTGTVANFAPASCMSGPPALMNAWTGAGDGTSWANIANWSLGRVPVAGDSVVINSTSSIQLSAPATVGWLVMGFSGAPTLSLNNGASLQIDSAAFTTSAATLNLSTGATLTGDGAISLGGPFNWNGGTVSGAGGMIIAPGGTATIATSGLSVLDSRPFAVAGTASMGAGGVRGVNAPSLTVIGGGVLEFPVTASFFSGIGGADSIRIQNAGTIRKLASAQAVRIDWPIVNVGRIEVLDDTLDLRNDVQHLADSIVISPNATLVVPGTLTSSAAVAIGSGGSLYLRNGGVNVNPGNHLLALASTLSGAGTFRTVNADTVVVQGRVDVNTLMTGAGYFEILADTMYIANGNYLGGGFVAGTGVLSIGGGSHTGGTYFIQTGNFTGHGTVHVAAAGALNISGAGMRGWDLVVDGTWSWTDNDVNLVNHPDAPFNDYVHVLIRPGGLLTMSHAAAPRTLQFTGGSTFINQGTIAKPNGISTTTINGLQIANSGGAINGTLGTIHITNGCSSIGTVSGSVTIGGGGACGP